VWRQIQKNLIEDASQKSHQCVYDNTFTDIA